ncbi:MAG TPA: hypothetical protein VIU62_04795, partial [Chloroflexota bacterium]
GVAPAKPAATMVASASPAASGPAVTAIHACLLLTLADVQTVSELSGPLHPGTADEASQAGSGYQYSNCIFKAGTFVAAIAGFRVPVTSIPSTLKNGSRVPGIGSEAYFGSNKLEVRQSDVGFNIALDLPDGTAPATYQLEEVRLALFGIARIKGAGL